MRLTWKCAISLGLLSLTGTGCEDIADTPTIDAYVVVSNAAGVAGIESRPIPIRNPETLSNDTLDATFGATIELTAETRPGQPVEYGGIVTGGEKPRLKVAKKGTAYVALDNDALVALTTIHHIFVARRHFESLGMPATAIPKLSVQFFPRKIETPLLFGQAPITDNAFFARGLSGFGILRPAVLDSLPLSMNPGVMAHEYSHAVFSALTEKKQAYRLLFRDFDEGLADVHGAALSGDPRFVGRSVPTSLETRDLSVARKYQAELQQAYAEDPYAYGSVVASVFWSFGARAERSGVERTKALELMARVAFEGLRDVDVPTSTDLAEVPLRGGNVRDFLEARLWRVFESKATTLGHRREFCESVVASITKKAAVEGVCP